MADFEREEVIDPTWTLTVSMQDLALILDNFGFDDPTTSSYQAFQRLSAQLSHEKMHHA